MVKLLHGTYVGPNHTLVHESALLKDYGDKDYYLAQFDNIGLSYAFGWHKFPKRHFLTDKCGEDVDEQNRMASN